MSVSHDDKIATGQTALEQHGWKGEGTQISSWGLGEVSQSLWSSYSQTLQSSDNLSIF